MHLKGTQNSCKHRTVYNRIGVFLAVGDKVLFTLTVILMCWPITQSVWSYRH